MVDFFYTKKEQMVFDLLYLTCQLLTFQGLLVTWCTKILNFLKPTGYVMHQQFNLLKPTGYVIHQNFNLFKAYWLRDEPTV
jgi:hypothetical protein